MPQILIREKDYTRPGLSEYSNFSVVVPGFVSDECDIEKYFDENGICELASQSEFLEKIGKVAPRAIESHEKTIQEAIQHYENQSQVKINIINNDTADGSGNIHNYAIAIKASPTGGSDVADSGLTHIRVLVDNTELMPVLTEDGSNYYTFVPNESPEGIQVNPGEAKPVKIQSTYGLEGKTYSNYDVKVIDNGVFKAESEVSALADTFTWQYAFGDSDQFVSPATETLNFYLGNKPSTTEIITTQVTLNPVPAHYGNQEAFELLGLGYPVLYVNMGKFNANDVDKQEEMIAAVAKLGTDDFWAGLRDKATYDYRFVVTGLIESTASINRQTGTITESEANNAAQAIARLAAFSADTTGNINAVSMRGDVTALLDVDEALINVFLNGNKTQTAIITAIRKAINKMLPITNGQYSAIFTPSVCYAGMDDTTYNNNKFPASFHYLACFIRSVNELKNPEWFAAAGMTRGLSNLAVNGTAYKLGEIAINALEPRCIQSSNDDSTPCNVACNVIAKIRDIYYLWGNRTAYALGVAGAANGDLVASHFLNIRQLCSTLKKQIYQACRRYTFDPNSDVLWINFCNSIRPTLERMKADQGIVDYKIIQVATSQKAKLKARIRIIPIEAVEDFDIEVSLEDSFGDVSTTITE